MANLDGLLTNPWVNIGLGLLAANKPGGNAAQAIGEGGLLGLASMRRQQEYARWQQEQVRRQQIREAEMRMAQAELEQAQREAERRSQFTSQLPQHLQPWMEMGMQKQVFDQMYPSAPTGFYRDEQGGLQVDPTYADFELRRRAAGATRVSVGGMEKPAPVSDIKQLSLPGGGAIPYGVTPTQLRDAGAVVTGAEQRKTVAKFERGLAVMDELERLAFGDPTTGEKGAFTGITPGIISRAKATGKNVYDYVQQEDTKAEEYNSLAQGTVAPLIKALGDTGNIAVREADRALAALAQSWPITDSEPAAKRKLKNLRGMIERGLEKARKKGMIEDVYSRAGVVSGTGEYTNEELLDAIIEGTPSE